MGEDERSEGLPEIIKNIMSSPEIADIIAGAGLADKAPGNISDERSEVKAESPSLSPELLEKLPKVVSALSDMGVKLPQGEGSAAQGANALSPDIMSKLPLIMSALSGTNTGSSTGSVKKSTDAPRKSGDHNHKALLTALRPYMNEHKQSVIDAMLQLNSLTEIMSSLTGGKNNVL